MLCRGVKVIHVHTNPKHTMTNSCMCSKATTSIWICFLQCCPRGGEERCVPRDNLFSTTEINPSQEMGDGEGGSFATAGSAYRSTQVKSVWCAFRFLLQQRRSVSVSDGLNEGLVSRATGSRSTRPGLCVYYQSALVSAAGYVQHSPISSPCLTPTPFTHKRPHLQEWASTHPCPPTPSPFLSSHQSTSSAHTLNTLHLLTHR